MLPNAARLLPRCERGRRARDDRSPRREGSETVVPLRPRRERLPDLGAPPRGRGVFFARGERRDQGCAVRVARPRRARRAPLRGAQPHQRGVRVFLGEDVQRFERRERTRVFAVSVPDASRRRRAREAVRDGVRVRAGGGGRARARVHVPRALRGRLRAFPARRLGDGAARHAGHGVRQLRQVSRRRDAERVGDARQPRARPVQVRLRRDRPDKRRAWRSHLRPAFWDDRAARRGVRLCRVQTEKRRVEERQRRPARRPQTDGDPSQRQGGGVRRSRGVRVGTRRRLGPICRARERGVGWSTSEHRAGACAGSQRGESRTRLRGRRRDEACRNRQRGRARLRSRVDFGRDLESPVRVARTLLRRAGRAADVRDFLPADANRDATSERRDLVRR